MLRSFTGQFSDLNYVVKNVSFINPHRGASVAAANTHKSERADFRTSGFDEIV